MAHSGMDCQFLASPKDQKTNPAGAVNTVLGDIRPDIVDVARGFERKSEAFHARLRFRPRYFSSRAKARKNRSPSTPSPRSREVQPSSIRFRNF